MTASWIVRQVSGDDFPRWLPLWRAYCASLDHAVSDEISEGVWSRILSPREPIWCIFVSNAGDTPQGFANYVLHPHTWSLKPVCYLEDIFVAPQIRRQGAGRVLIEKLSMIGSSRGRTMCATTSTFDLSPAAATAPSERSSAASIEIEHPCDHSISRSYEYELFANTDPLMTAGRTA